MAVGPIGEEKHGPAVQAEAYAMLSSAGSMHGEGKGFRLARERRRAGEEEKAQRWPSEVYQRPEWVGDGLNCRTCIQYTGGREQRPVLPILLAIRLV